MKVIFNNDAKSVCKIYKRFIALEITFCIKAINEK